MSSQGKKIKNKLKKFDDNPSFDTAIAKMKGEIINLKEEQEELKKEFKINLSKNRQVKMIYDKVSNGFAINDLESMQIGLIRLDI